MKTTILCGIPGSGKTFSTQAGDTPTPIVSADHYFIFNGEYRFDPSKLGEAHGQCLRYFIARVRAGEDVIVDNTNTGVAEIAPYMSIALAYGAEVEVKVFLADPEVCAKRNTHGVPLKACQGMHARLLATLEAYPPFWAKPTIIKQ